MFTFIITNHINFKYNKQMKKIFLILIVLLLSCSSDDSEDDNIRFGGDCKCGIITELSKNEPDGETDGFFSYRLINNCSRNEKFVQNFQPDPNSRIFNLENGDELCENSEW